MLFVAIVAMFHDVFFLNRTCTCISYILKFEAKHVLRLCAPEICSRQHLQQHVTIIAS